MSTDYQKLQIKRFPSLSGRKTAESRYWRRFKFPITVKEYAAVTSIDFSPVTPHDFAVTSSTRLQIYSPQTHAVVKTISRFNDVVHSGKFRGDGKLLVAGDDAGIVQVFDRDTRNPLRSFKDHTGPVHFTQFSPDNIRVLSAADDKTVRCWDLPTGTSLMTFEEHEDYVRTGAVSLSQPNLWITGSYDRTVKLWDMRSSSSITTLNHDHPVESVLMFPNGGMVLSAGGNTIKVWDMLKGGRLLYSFSNHQKTITGMCFDSSFSRLISCSLDHHIKIYSTQDFKTMHSVKYSAPLLSVAISPDDTHLVTGMSNGMLSIRQRLIKTEDLSKNQEWKKTLNSGTYRYFIRGKSQSAGPDEFIVSSLRKPKLRKFDVSLRKFQYKNALDASLLSDVRPVVTVSLIEELILRDGLRIALSGRDETTLEPILSFVVKHITNPRYAMTLLQVGELILSTYGSIMGQSMSIDELLVKLNAKLKQEVYLQKSLLQLQGALDTLFAISSKGDVFIGQSS